MSIKEMQEYQLISDYYGVQRAQRSQVLLINHIDEGLAILEAISAPLSAQQAYCLHPIFQADEDLLNNYQINLEKIAPIALLLCLEYRNIANQYLSNRRINKLEEIKLSPLEEVNQMLIADKVQNRKDFELYHLSTHPRSQELDRYFRNWLARLEISEAAYQKLTNLL